MIAILLYNINIAKRGRVDMSKRKLSDRFTGGVFARCLIVSIFAVVVRADADDVNRISYC